MAKEVQGINALGAQAAYNLANVTKTKPQYGALTPKWLTKLLEFKGLETGIYRVNKVVEGETPLDVLCSQTKKSDIIPDGYIEYETEPREYRLNSISTIININRVDLFVNFLFRISQEFISINMLLNIVFTY